MATKAIKQHKTLREVWINEVNELKTYAENSLTDDSLWNQFKIRFMDIEKMITEFQNNHLALTVQLSSVENADLDTEEVIRKDFNNTIYRIKEIYFRLFDKPVSTQVQPKLPNVKLPKINLQVFSGNAKEWPAFFDLFNAMIHSNSTLSNIEKFQYLLSSLSKAALSSIKSIALSDDNYDIAYNTLVDRFQNKRLLANCYWQEMVETPKLNSDSASDLRNLLDCFSENLEGLKKLNLPVDSWSFVLFQVLIKKLHPEIVKRFELHYASNEIPSYQNLIAFLKTQCTALESVVLNSKGARFNSRNTTSANVSRSNNFTTSSLFVAGRSSGSLCLLCNGPHVLTTCKLFLKKTPFDRYGFAKRKSLCLNCLQSSHHSNNCSSNSSCRQCGSKHHELLHFLKNSSNHEVIPTRDNSANQGNDLISPSSSTNSPSDISNTISSVHSGVSTPEEVGGLSNNNSSFIVLLATAMVDVLDIYGKPRRFRAMLDSGSQASFVSRRCSEMLGLPQSRLSLEIKGLGNTSSKAHSSMELSVCPIGKANPNIQVDAIIIPRICDMMPSSRVSRYNWAHISNIKLADPNFHLPQEVDILLGSDVLSSILLSSQLRGGADEPFAQNTIFGWVLMGKVTDKTSRTINSFFSLLEMNELNNTLKKFWEVEEVPHTQLRTEEEELCENNFVENVCRDVSGRYSVALPFKNGPPSLMENRSIALRRLFSLEKRLKSNEKLYEAYSSFMKDYLESNHMNLAVHPPSDVSRCYYIPHFCVFKPDSNSSKFRVVFDASVAPPGGESLNQTLLTGPKLQTDIAQVLISFRCHRFVFTADIRQMYRQILVHPEYRDYQRILWRFSFQDPVQEYQLRTVTYGLNSSPYLAIRVLHQLARDEGENFPLAARVLVSELYVDDLVTGSDSLEEAKSLQLEIISLLDKGGFELRKWASNHPSLLSNLPREFCQQSSLSFDKEDSCTVKILGLKWFPGVDSFSYEVEVSNRLCTKRNILSDLARIFDPLGFLTPISFFAKYLMQLLWSLGLEWDQEPPDDIKSKWLEFRLDLKNLSTLKIPRYYFLNGKVSYQLHGFCDTSEKGYAAVVYIRSHNTSQVDVSLIMGKSRVAPLKKISIARLELCAAVLLSDLLEFVQQSLRVSLPLDEIFAWSDSSIALHWIHSSPHRWQTFVANRVTRIQNKVESRCWRHVSTKDNPADCASRGLFPSMLLEHPLWWTGPPWLKDSSNTWPVSRVFTDVQRSEEISKESKKVVLATTVVDDNFFDRLLADHSKLSRILTIVSYIQRFIFNLRKPSIKKCGKIFLWDLESSELLLVKNIQNIVFQGELSLLKTNKLLPKSFRKLSPFLDEEGILRVGGRLAQANLSFGKRFPILLPQNHRFTKLLIEHYHAKYLHPGIQTLRCLIVQKYWILNAKRAIRSVISNCNRCFRVRPSPIVPLMGNLPLERINQLKPFSCVGVDFGGPYLVTMSKARGVKSTKAYICLFVCFVTRAIHLELASDLSTEAFLAALRRFIARRGRCSVIHSDCGTNFVGANKYLRDIFRNATENERIEFKFNCPSAPHFGGIWEAGIKCTKVHLSRVIGEQILTFEEFYTILVQIEAVLNSRPLCELSSDPNDFSALTPGHFLTLEPLTCIPDPDYSQVNFNRLSRWQLLQRMHRDFWKRWHIEYLNTLQQRQKWNRAQPQLAVGKLVLIKDDLLPPLRWRLGRVTEVHIGTDNICRVATVKTVNGIFQRPLIKLCPLPSQ